MTATGAASAGNGWDVAAGADPPAFRTAMRRCVSAVTVLTTEHDGRPWGMTVSAFTPVCTEPPTVLVCVRRDTRTATVLVPGARFGANLLSEDQLYLSRLCARPGTPKFVDRYVLAAPELPAGVLAPVLRDSLTTFDCAVTDTRPVGSHLVVLGEVRAVLAPAARPPLLYGAGRYQRGTDIDETPALTGALAWI
jgi:flavin reductase (DIM6/NTAB) family NADH-FMN oxidoreductase RutF